MKLAPEEQQKLAAMSAPTIPAPPRQDEPWLAAIRTRAKAKSTASAVVDRQMLLSAVDALRDRLTFAPSSIPDREKLIAVSSDQLHGNSGLCRVPETMDGGTEAMSDNWKKERGHLKLIGDLGVLLKRAEAGEYNDFYSPHATPKMLLGSELNRLRMNVQNGEYD